MSDDPKTPDLAGNPAGIAVHWVIPIAAMVALIGTPHPVKTWIWAATLVWMGSRCLRNARRCGRGHCFWTRSFFLAMTLPVLAYGYELLQLGDDGWRWLGVTVGLGSLAIIAATEARPIPMNSREIWQQYARPISVDHSAL